nr:MAG: hypothetical protein H4RhizoLitter2099_000001 [Totiviridae sp.]
MASGSLLSIQAGGSLVGALAGDPTGQIQTDDQYRRYRAGLSIGVFEHGSLTYKRRSIFYEVGRRYSRLSDALAYNRNDTGGIDIDASVSINPAQAANFEGWARKYSNFAPQWEMMDLCAIVERLAKGVAAQSVFGAVGTSHLRGGQDIRVVALGTLDSPQTASTSSVFIPRTVDSVGMDHVFAVLVAAANGEGASVTTDVLRLNPITSEPIVPAVSGPAFATACVEALRILGANFEESGAGDLFSYAVTRGVHYIVSVVSHSDEGGWFRGALRACRFRVPYGGINQALRAYPALPPLASSSASAASAWVDAIALKTAGLVAHCDPCVTGPGGLYPTVFTSNTGSIGAAGCTGEAGTDNDARAIGRQISGDTSRFAPTYIRGLNMLFGRQTNSGVAEAHFSSAVASAAYDSTDRHLRHKTVAPYFWVEPTSLIPNNYLGSVAERAGCGSLATVGLESTTPYFERLRELDRGMHANYSTIAFKMRSARTSGLVAAYAATPADLAGLKLYQFDESSIVLAGDQGPTPGDVPSKHAAADPLSSYLWKRGQSPIPAPAEFLNIQGSYAAKYKIVTWDDDFDATLGDVPEVWEMEQHDVRWRVTVPTAISPGKSNAPDTGARRARARAAIALAQASIRSRGWGESASPVITISNSPPTWDDITPVPAAHTGLQTHASDPGRTLIPAVPNEPPPVVEHLGAPLAPVPHHQPLRGPPFPRQGGGLLSGYAPPPPVEGSPAGGLLPPVNDSDSHSAASDTAPANVGPAPPV